MANSLLIEKQTGGYFKFTLNGDTANAVTSIQNDLLAVGNQLHFKTGNGANIIKEQFIYPEDVTIVSGGTFTFTTIAQVWDKLIDIDYFAWLGSGGGSGVYIDRFDDLVDTFKYTGNAGKTVVVDNSELKLVPVTLYNKRLFTELDDTPDSLVPNKMVVVNSAGNALILQDQPEAPESLLNSVGYFDYNDLITQTTPLTAVTNTPLKLTNDSEGANTSTDQNPYGVSYVWDSTTNQFNFSELSVGDTIDVRVHVQVTTTTSNQKVDIKAKFGIGSVAEFTNSIFETTFKSSGTHEVSFVAPFYMGSTYITDYPAELYLTTDASATVQVDGWYIRIIRKDINIITVDYAVPDATTLVKGIVRLGGDLAGTANSPTVPELANKVPTSRTIGTTSPLLGGGALTSDLALSIQQANSTQPGYLSASDWSTFYNKANDNAVVHLTGDETITGRKTFNSSTDIGIRSNNSGSGYGIYSENSSTGTGYYVANNGQGKAFLVANALSSFGNMYEGSYNGTSNFAVNYLGEITASKFIKSGGTTFEFLKANGDVDSNIYFKGSVTAGYLPKSLYPSSGDFTTSLIYDNGTNIGIGTASPNYSSSGRQVVDINGTSQSMLALSVGGVGKSFLFYTGTDLLVSNESNGAIKFNTNGSEKAIITSGGQVQISSPISDALKLTNTNSGAYNGLLIQNDASNQVVLGMGGSTVGGTNQNRGYSGTVSNIDYYLMTNNSPRLLITSGGNVGIDTTSPSQKLTIGDGTGTGNQYLRINSSSTDIYIGQSGSGLFGLAANSAGNIASDNTSYPLAIGTIASQSLIFGTANAERMRITSGGDVGIGVTSTSSYKLFVAGGQYGTYLKGGDLGTGSRALSVVKADNTDAFYVRGDGATFVTNLGTGLVYSNGGALTSTNPSDSRLKDDITDLQYGLNEILQLRPVSYNWKDDKINQGKQFGFIAQEVQEVMPELVKEFETEDGERLGLDKEGIYAALVNAIQEQQKQIEELKTLINK